VLSFDRFHDRNRPPGAGTGSRNSAIHDSAASSAAKKFLRPETTGSDPDYRTRYDGADRTGAGGPAMISALVVDADPALRSYLTGICENTGSFRVTTAESGEAALVWLFTNKADVIVSNQKLPGMTGVDLLRSLRAQDIRVPFIFFTEEDSDHLKNEAYTHDAYGFIMRNGTEKKPFLNLMRLMYWAAGYLDMDN
jgi:CheY-like chemotaxis protein